MITFGIKLIIITFIVIFFASNLWRYYFYSIL